MNKSEKIFGYVFEFPSSEALYNAAKKIKDKGYKKWDVHTPFPIHGMDGAMGLGYSKLPIIVFIGGLCGFLFAMFLQFFTQVNLYPTVVQDKPTDFFTIPSFFPVMFELTILFSAFSIVLGLFLFIRLPRWNHPLFNSELFSKCTDDGLFVVLEASDEKFDIDSSISFFEQLGVINIEKVNF